LRPFPAFAGVQMPLTAVDHGRLLLPNSILSPLTVVAFCRWCQWERYFSSGRAELVTDIDKQTLSRTMQAG